MAYKKKTFTEERPALRVPPYSAEAEQAVLGAILLDAPRAMEICAEADVIADSFWISANRTIFETAWRLYGSGKPVDVVTVSEELRVRGELDVVGGVAALERMVEATPAVAHADYYTSILREKHLLRRVISVAENAQEKCYAPDRSVQLIVSETEQEVLAISDTQKDRVLPWKDSVQQTIGKIESVLQRKDGINGISSGFRNLDERLRGLRNAEMIVLAARPSMGKTSLAMNICENVALGTNAGGKARLREPLPVGIFSCEMSTDALISRMLCSRAPENRDKEGTPRISDLRDSGAIEQDADVVMLLWRPSYYANKLKDQTGQPPVDDTIAKVDIGKNRNGATGVAELLFESEFTQFSDAMSSSRSE